MCVFFFFKQKTAYEMRISDWSSDVCSSDLADAAVQIHSRKAGPANVDAQWLAPGPDQHIGQQRPIGGVALGIDMIAGRLSLNPRDKIPEANAKRSEERRVGKECVSTCRSRWSPYH